MQTLEGIGAVVRDSRGRYRPGMLLLSLSQGVVEQDLWSRAPQRLLDGVAREMDCAIQIGTLEDGMVTYVARAGRQRPGPCFAVGMQFEAYCTAIGKVLLASLSTADFEAFLAEGELIALTANTIIEQEALTWQLTRIRQECWASDRGEMMDGLSCIAVPIHDAAGHVVAALSASEESTCPSDLRQQQLRRGLTETARAISTRLFPSGGDLLRAAHPPVIAEPRMTACGARW
jgi:DNA-binding IclR family transcriptional regulator